MHWLPLLELLEFSLASLQQPLTAETNQLQTPFDDVFDNKVKWALDHFHIPGVGIAVVRDSEVFTKGYGLSDIEASQPVTEHTHFFAGSTSKAHTAAAMSILIDDDVNYPEIQWDTPIHSLLPADFSLSETWSTAHTTIVDMLSHRSGLPRHDWVWKANLTLQEIVQSMRHLPLTAAPRTQWQYCNLMYSTAAHIIETKTNQSLYSFLAQNLWGPLNISETYLSLSHAQDAGKDIAQGYSLDLNGEFIATNKVYLEAIRGAGNVLTSAADYSKWMSAIVHRRLPISNESYAMLLGGHSIISANTAEPFQSPDLYGLGWALQTYGGQSLVSHNGAQYGYGASVALVPSRKFGVAVLGNNMIGTIAASDILTYHLIDEELGIPAKERFDWVSRADAMINQTHLPDNFISTLYPTIPDPPIPNPLAITAYEGTYYHPAYPDLIISSNCPKRSVPIPPSLNKTLPDLCGSVVNSNEYTKDEVFDFYHITSTFWVQIAGYWDASTASRVEFYLNSDGSVGLMGIEADDAMKAKGEKIWWTHGV
ncbi:protein flp, putative [Paecilomyces variotii No. 5]|uniref:Protein flp, putative n=1 Tax=Byssochlamys spectabilis (strain No. 5 / NBRC 109023) TaxID=1356009 RepID=V5G1U0_BYSSN|nr:protein flp, putative [Paecilomyces variotii No. 5]